MLGVTWGYAALNTVALLADRRRAKRKEKELSR